MVAAVDNAVVALLDTMEDTIVALRGARGNTSAR
jgi:hypothetical protein